MVTLRREERAGRFAEHIFMCPRVVFSCCCFSAPLRGGRGGCDFLINLVYFFLDICRLDSMHIYPFNNL